MIPHGLLSFPLTAFDPSGGMDLDAFSVHLESQVRPHIAGVFVACGTGEFTSLDPSEYRALVRRAVEIVDGRVPVFSGVGGGAATARGLLEDAVAAHADGVLLLPPYLITPSSEGLLQYVRWVVGSGPVPVIVYQRANAVYGPAMLPSLLQIPAVMGLKDGVGDIEAMARTVAAVRRVDTDHARRFGFLSGLPTAEVTAQAYRALGVDSYSSAVHAFAPDIAASFWEALQSGDHGRCSELLDDFFVPFAALRDRVPGYAVSLVKAGARLEGLDLGPVRPPLTEAQPSDVEELAGLIDAGRKVAGSRVEATP